MLKKQANIIKQRYRGACFMKVVIIGGGSAGTTCAFELRKRNKKVEIIIIEKTNYCEYSPCALPYLISQEITDIEKVFILKPEDYQNNNIQLFLNSEVIDIEKNKIIYKQTDQKKSITYDKLVLATGASCITPEIKGLNTTSFLQLKTIADVKKIMPLIKKDHQSVIIGGGMIGLELAEALTKRGEKVTLLEKEANLLPNLLDQDMASRLEAVMPEIEIINQADITEIANQTIKVKNKTIAFDKLFVCTGFMPNLSLANKLNLETNKGIIVNQYLQTSQSDVYAIGDCVEVSQKNSNQKNLSQLGTVAVRQGRIAAQNILGKQTDFLPVLNTTITKIGTWYIGSVGLKTQADYLTTTYTSTIRANYYNAEEKMTVKLICQRDGILVGGQIIGQQEVAGHLHLIALAVDQKMTVKQLANLETSYNPAVITIFNPVTTAAEILAKKVTFSQDKR